MTVGKHRPRVDRVGGQDRRRFAFTGQGTGKPDAATKSRHASYGKPPLAHLLSALRPPRACATSRLVTVPTAWIIRHQARYVVSSMLPHSFQAVEYPRRLTWGTLGPVCTLNAEPADAAARDRIQERSCVVRAGTLERAQPCPKSLWVAPLQTFPLAPLPQSRAPGRICGRGRSTMAQSAQSGSRKFFVPSCTPRHISGIRPFSICRRRSAGTICKNCV